MEDTTTVAAQRPAAQPVAPQPAPTVDALIELARRACTAYGRPDLVARVDDADANLRGRRVLAAVAGDFNQGKSSLVNALIGYTVCPDTLERTTTVPTSIVHGPSTAVSVCERADGDVTVRRATTFDALADVVAPPAMDPTDGLAPPAGDRHVLAAEVAVPAPLLEGGLVLVDCPGAGGLGAMGRMRSLASIAGAAALLYVTDATSELSEIDLQFLAVAVKVCPLVVIVLTKTDLVPFWRDVEERNRIRLEEAGLTEAGTGPLTQLAVSARLAAHAWWTQDAELAQLCGLDELRTFLRDAVVGQADRLARRVTLVELGSCVEQLGQQLEAERLALDDPRAGAARQVELEVEAERLRALREAAARWQTTLADGIADLTADVEHDLRERLRRIGRDADDTIDAEDPFEMWDTFEPWLYGQVADAVAENFALLRTRTTAVVAATGRLFQADLAAIGDGSVAVADPTEAVSGVQIDASVRLTRMTAGQRALTALRGSYGGVLMASFVSHQSAVLAGFAPGAAALMGLLMGNKAVKDESDRQLAQRRGVAKQAQRRYTDEVSFVVGKYSRDHLRRIQRTLRDRCLAQAQEFERTSRTSLDAVRRALDADAETRAARRADVTEELHRIAGLADRIVACSAATGAVIVPATPGPHPEGAVRDR